MHNICWLFVVAVLLFTLRTSATEVKISSPAQKIVSINLCLDGLILKLVDRSRIDSLYYLSAQRQYSPFADQTKGIFMNRGLAEDIVPRNPDLIVAGEFSSGELVVLLKQLKLHVEVLALPRSIAEITAHIRRLGVLLASEKAANDMAFNIEQQLALLDVEQHQKQKINAFWYASNGVVVGGGTLENELMEHAGFHNLAIDKHINGFVQIDLEELILAQPQVIIVESSDVEAFSLAREYIKHPALRKNNIHIVALPSYFSVCSAPVLADVMQELRMQLNRLYPVR